jgi:uncharacterized protein
MNLQPPRFNPLPFGCIRPLGWLKNQLRIQADGLSGHLDEFWPDLKDSAWFGGSAEGWERAPYWLDGVIPLAWLLDDEPLKTRVSRYVGYILDHQSEDGWLGPEMPAGYDLWAVLLIDKVLVEYHRATGEERALTALRESLRNLDRQIDRRPLFNWGAFRWFEGLVSVYYLYERYPEDWLLELAVKLQAQGFHWGDFFARWPFTQATQRYRWNYMSHVVNNAMAVKAHGLWGRLSGEAGDRAAVYEMIEKLERYHGMPTGMFTGDECLAGKKPTQGSELCAVVEYAYSLETLLSIYGDPVLGDRLEQIIFNALPATFSLDMWAHQYDQQANQVECSIGERPWNSNGPQSNLFGVEPNFGCCTANLSQGWPKFTAHLWMRSADGGLAVAAYAPSAVEVEIESVPVRVVLETDYPFQEQLRFRVSLPAGKALKFPLWLRIPAWTSAARLELGGEIRAADPGSFYRLERLWQGDTDFTLTLPMRPELLRGYNRSVALKHGPLVYALKIGEDWRRVNESEPYREPPHADWEIYPTTPWNYAVRLDEQSLTEQVRFIRRAVGERPFSPEGAPLEARVWGRRLPGWGMDELNSADVPAGPQRSEQPLEELTLIPYGCTNLRVTEFPVLEDKEKKR